MPRSDLMDLTGKSLHELKRGFAMDRTKEQCCAVRRSLPALIAQTEQAAPVRQGKFMLTRENKGHPKGPEAVLERCLWDACRQPKGRPFLAGHCRWLQSYQIPLKGKRTDSGWGKIDLLGVSPDGLPVIVELKVEDSSETPLRMILEALTYGIAIRKIWADRKSDFQREWCIDREGIPSELSRMTLIGVAPRAYYEGKKGRAGALEAVKEAWSEIAGLVHDLDGYGFSFVFAALDAKNCATEVPLPSKGGR